MELAEKIYATVRLIPRGKVATYSQIAALVGNCNLRHYVGNALHKNPSNEVTPCHRVVNAKGFCSGSFAFDGPGVQQEKLEAEGVIFVDGHVDMERFEITPDDFEMMRAGLLSLLAQAFKMLWASLFSDVISFVFALLLSWRKEEKLQR